MVLLLLLSRIYEEIIGYGHENSTIIESTKFFLRLGISIWTGTSGTYHVK